MANAAETCRHGEEMGDMKVSFKRSAAGLAALAAAASGALLLSVRAAEDGYVLRINKDAYVCASPFVADYTLTGEDGQTVFSGEDFVEVYHLTADGAGSRTCPSLLIPSILTRKLRKRQATGGWDWRTAAAFPPKRLESSGRLCSGRTPQGCVRHSGGSQSMAAKSRAS
ncbi:MAG: hypothetical protein ACLS4A_12215 [Oscillospiraceae bacterium]